MWRDDDHAEVVFAQLLAEQLEHLLMVLVAGCLKGRAEMPLLIQPATPATNHLTDLLRAGSDNLADAHTGFLPRCWSHQYDDAAARNVRGASTSVPRCRFVDLDRADAANEGRRHMTTPSGLERGRLDPSLSTITASGAT
ncbi:hypothetical protein [Nonomuraea sp. NPDC049400]|uniref:hypothetical protein n=1 Tax=Nonomuraea sp. NPDC049400 TaxID=3364352 RepID=UPI0037A2A529